MSVENYFLSREGRNLSNKILNFIGSLIIKMKPEADEEETKSTYIDWMKYKHAIEETDNIYEYEYNDQDFYAAGITISTAIAKGMRNKEKCFELTHFKDPDALRLLAYLRKKYINEYVERNTYYSQFQGKPRPGQEIYITNKDKVTDEDPDVIPIEEVKISSYPLTYQYVFIDGKIEEIRKKNPSFFYLKYLVKPISIYRVRSANNFDILDYDQGSLTDNELSKFFECYTKNKIYMDKMMYIYGFNDRMPMYPFVMELLLLQATVTGFFNSYMDNYALANYTDQEIYDILDSYNLGSLKKVSMNILRNIIRDIPDFIELRGSDLVIEKILDKVADDSVTIKRYYLIKTYPTNAENQTKFDLNKNYDQNVGIAFKEKIIRRGASTEEPGIIDYDTFVESDDTWGGELADLSEQEKAKVRENFKKEVLKMDFSSILSKYITISATVDSYVKQIEMTDKLGLLWQWLQKNGNNFMVNDLVPFEAYQIRPIDMYAAICWIYSFFNGVSEPDKINTANMNIANVMKLQDSGINSLVQDVTGNGLDSDDPNYQAPATLHLPAGLGDKTIVSILGTHNDSDGSNDNTSDPDWPYYKNQNPGSDNYGKDDINYESVFVSFSPNTTLSQLFAEYDKNAAIIAAIKQKWLESSTLEESRSWEYLLQQNRTNTLFEILFDNYESFRDFIRESNSDFYNYISLIIDDDSGTNQSLDAIFDLYIKLTEKFKEYMSEATENYIRLTVPNGDSSTDSVSYLNDLKLLLNEFLSIYSELHKIEYAQSINDEPYNHLKLLYSFGADIFYDSANDVNHLKGKIIDDEKYDLYKYRMLKHEEIKDFESLIKEINSYIEILNERPSTIQGEFLKNLAKQNLLTFVNEKIEEIEKRRELSTTHLITQELQDRLDLLISLKNKLDTEDPITYYEIISTEKGKWSGKGILIEFANSEIDTIKGYLEDISKDKNILPTFEYVVSDMLFEYYKETIALVLMTTNGKFVNSEKDADIRHEQLYYVGYDTILNDELEIIKLRDSYDEMKTIMYETYKDGISLTHVGFDYIISFTTFLEDYILLRYENVKEEFFEKESDKVSIRHKLGKMLDFISSLYKEFVGVDHSFKETDIAFTLPIEAKIELILKKMDDLVEDTPKERLNFKYLLIEDSVGSGYQEKINISDTTKTIED